MNSAIGATRARWGVQPLHLLLILAMAAAMLVPLSSGQTADASHFRSGHASFTWETGPGTEVAFRIQNSWRRGGYFSCIDPSQVENRNNPSAAQIPCSGDDAHPEPGDIFYEDIGTGPGTIFDFGDGNDTSGLYYRVDSVDRDRDWLFAFALDPDELEQGNVSTTVRHEYETPGDYTASIQACCRLSSFAGHVNNPDGNYRVEGDLTVGGPANASPRSVMPPIVVCEVGQVCEFPVFADDPDGDQLQFRLATGEEASGSPGGFTQPGDPHAPNDASIHEETGIYTWDTAGAQNNAPNTTYYSTQVIIEDLDDITGEPKSKVAVDFFIELRESVNRPTFPGHTPGVPTTVYSAPGETITFEVRAVAADENDEITLNVLNIPDGAEMDPELPHTDVGEVASTFSWTPGASGSGASVQQDEGDHQVVFEARDEQGNSAVLNYVIRVQNVDSLEVTPSEARVAPGQEQEFTATATFEDDTEQDVTGSATWTSDDEDVATVSNGVATGVANGTAEITAEYGGHDDTAEITVRTPTDLTVEPAEATIGVDDTQQFTATASFDDEPEEDVTEHTDWSSSDTDVATIDDAGLATGVDAGTVDIDAEFGGLSASASLTVEIPDEVFRLFGDDRIETAIDISQATFADADAATQASFASRHEQGLEAQAVVLARSTDFPDALAGTPLAEAVVGPVLLTPASGLDPRVADEIERILPAGGTVHLLGGTVALQPQVQTALDDMGYDTDRIEGETRFETAVAIADRLDRDTLLITTGVNFPDALAAGAAAAANDGAVLLTTSDRPHPAVDAYLADNPDAETYGVGGPAARAYPDATEVFGPTREDTAVEVAETFFDEPNHVGLARRDAFPDALAGGAHVGRLGGPLLLTLTNRLHEAPEAYLCDNADSLHTTFLYGGPVAVTEATADVIADRASGLGCE